MTNKTFEPVGLLEITKQLKTNRKSVDDLEERLHSALDAKRDVASDYVEQLDSIAEKEVEVKLDPFSDLLQTTIASNSAMWKAGYDAGYEVGYEVGLDDYKDRKGSGILNRSYHEGFKAGSLSSTEPTSEQRDRELLESHGIDVDGCCDQMVKLVKDHEQDIDDTGDVTSTVDEMLNYGGTK